MSRKKLPRGFDPESTSALVSAAIANAERLLADADVLELRGSFGPAASLTVVALEEMGKALALRLGDQIFAGIAKAEPEPDPDGKTERTTFTTVFDSHAVKKIIVFSFVPLLSIRYSAEVSATPPVNLEPAKFADAMNLVWRAIQGDASVHAEHGSHAGFQFLMAFLPAWMVQIDTVARQYETLRVRGLYVDVEGAKVIDPLELTADSIRPIRDYSRFAMGVSRRAAMEGLPDPLIALFVDWVQKYGTTEATRVDRSRVPPPPGGWGEVDRTARETDREIKRAKPKRARSRAPLADDISESKSRLILKEIRRIRPPGGETRRSSQRAQRGKVRPDHEEDVSPRRERRDLSLGEFRRKVKTS
ncbi:MAG: AbiV family abortive infection protein [Thermoplasmata archaeon]|nr:AbiV family abortive infection protein [Thermoplasmata archaeon]